MSSSRAVVTGDAVRRARAVAECEEWEFVASFHRQQVAEIDRSDEVLLTKELARREVTLELAQALRITEHRVWAMVHEATTIREKVPGIWASFRSGDIDASRVSAIADTAARLTTPEALAALEASAPAYAATHTLAELRAWLRRLRARLEPDQTQTETAKAVEERRVSITHNDDGTSWLNAPTPTPTPATATGAPATRSMPT